MNSKDIGNVAEAKILTHLLEKGYNVLLPFGDNCRYDIVREKNGKFVRIQIKSREITNGSIKIELRSSNKKAGKIVHKYYTSSDVDEIWIYCPSNGFIYKISLRDISQKTTLTLRTDPVKNYQKKNIMYASDFQQ